LDLEENIHSLAEKLRSEFRRDAHLSLSRLNIGLGILVDNIHTLDLGHKGDDIFGREGKVRVSLFEFRIENEVIFLSNNLDSNDLTELSENSKLRLESLEGRKIVDLLRKFMLKLRLSKFPNLCVKLSGSERKLGKLGNRFLCDKRVKGGLEECVKLERRNFFRGLSRSFDLFFLSWSLLLLLLVGLVLFNLRKLLELRLFRFSELDLFHLHLLGSKDAVKDMGSDNTKISCRACSQLFIDDMFSRSEEDVSLDKLSDMRILDLIVNLSKVSHIDSISVEVALKRLVVIRNVLSSLELSDNLRDLSFKEELGKIIHKRFLFSKI